MRFCTIICFVFLLLSASGCSKKNLPADLPKLNPVSATVIQSGKPLAGASVSLIPIDSGNKWSATGTTDTNGVVKKFFTNGMYAGVVTGKFKVIIRKTESDRKEEEIPPEPKDPAERYQWRQKYIENRPRTTQYDLVDKKFFDIKTTPLEAEIKGTQNEFSFDVGEAVRILYKR